MNARRIIAAAVLMGTTASAQGIITPSYALADTCATSTSFLTPQSPGSSWQQVHSFLTTAPMTLRSMAFRLRKPGASRLTVTLSVDLSHPTILYNAMGMDPDANHGPDRTRVVTSQVVKIDSPATLREGAMAFDLRIPFDRPFAYNGSRGLCWEVFLEATDWAGSPGFDYHDPAVSRTRREWTMGQPCQPAGWPRLQTTWRTLQIPYNATMDLTLSGNAGTPAVVGFDMRYSVNGLPEPFRLPGTSCTSYVSPQVFAPTLVGPLGRSQFSVFASPSTAWQGTTIYMQAFALAPSANPLGVLTSNGRAMRINGGAGELSVLFFPNQRTGLGIRYIREGLATRFN